MKRRFTYLAALVVLAGVLVLGAVWHVGPAITLSVALAVPTAEPLLAPFASEPAREEVWIDAGGAPLRADLYRPATPRSALVLVHGLSPAGHRHPELVRLASLLARRNVAVLVPRFDGLADFRLSGREVDQVSAALAHARTLRVPVGVAGFSFGAGPALIAAAEAPDVRVVGSFGGYADLRHVVRFIAAGVHELGGHRHVQAAEPYNRWKLLALLAGLVDDPGDRAVVGAVATRKLADPLADTAALEAVLGDEGRAMVALAQAHDDGEVTTRLAALPPRVAAALDRLSAVAVAPRLTGRLVVAHGAHDTSIPYTESLRLARAAGEHTRVAILKSFHHAGGGAPRASLLERAGDGWQLLHLVDALLATH